MKVQPARIEGFIESINKSEVFSALIYGPDFGGVSNLAEKLSAKIVDNPSDPFSTSVIDNEKIANEPTSIFDELSSISLFGGKKLVLFKTPNQLRKLLMLLQL